MNRTLTDDDFAAAAAAIGCEVAVIRAVDEVESRGAGFDDQGRVTILFERHKFRKYTDRRFDESHPHLSHRYLPPRQNPSYRRDQWELMNEAVELDRTAALMSASWGRFQVMGFNWRATGCDSIEQFVQRMRAGVRDHLLMFVAFVRYERLDRFLIAKDFLPFAEGYNGPDHAANNYVGKLQKAYAKHAKGSAQGASSVTILGGV